MKLNTLLQARQALGVSHQTIYSWINAGKLDVVRFESRVRVEGSQRGSQVFVLQSEIDRILASRTPPAQPKQPAIRIVISRATGTVISDSRGAAAATHSTPKSSTD